MYAKLKKSARFHGLVAIVSGVIIAVVGFSILASQAANKTSDLNNDGQVNVLDLSILLSKWGTTGTQPADINSDSIVSILDLSILLSSWGTVGAPSTPVPTGVPGTWTLKFQDEFDGTDLNASKWSKSWFNGGTMNNTPTSTNNVRVSGGNLLLTLASSTSGALVNTNPSDNRKTGFTFTTGYAEARINFPGNGSVLYNWPAWWTDGQNWPQDEEHDIAEIRGWSSGDGTMSSAYHYSNNGAHASKGSGTIAGTWSNAYHIYGIHRKTNSVDIYYDGKIVWTYTTTGLNPPHYLILNVGYEGKNLVTGAGSEVKVDYVRVWQ
jgi:hypothetical protein